MFTILQYFLYTHKIQIIIKKIIKKTPKKLQKEFFFLNRGKKLRPRLMYQVAKSFNIPPKKIIFQAAILEIIHSVTLLHDDIIDKESKRRGKKTLYHQKKNQASILLGDYLLSLCLETLSKTSPPWLQKEFYQKIKEVCLGEIKQDMENQFEKKLSKQDCLLIAKKKTGALFALCFKTPPLLAGMPKPITRFAEECGYAYGTIYQLLDDLKDIKKDNALSKNLKNFKHWTLPSVLWVKKSPSTFKKFLLSPSKTIPPVQKNFYTQGILKEINALLQPLERQKKENPLFTQLLYLAKTDFNSFLKTIPFFSSSIFSF